MKATTVLTTLLTANLALGAMWTQKRRETRAANLLKMANSDSSDPITRSEGDSARTPSSRPLKFQEKTSASTKFAAAASTNNNTKTHSTYSQNWAGALLVNTKFTAVTGTIVVPTPSGANAAVQSAGAAWIGIDGGTCASAILQTGIDWYVTGSTVTYDAWYEWYPDYSYDFSGITLHGGDVVRMTVFATSSTTGAAYIENLTTGKVVSQPLSVAASAALCQTNAEWIVEDFTSCDSSGNCGLVPFAKFGAVTFTNSLATHGGTTVTPGTAGENLLVLDLYQNSQVLTNCVVNGATVGCTHL